MAKIEISAQELEVLKKAAQKYHDGGADQARAVLENSGVDISISPEANVAFSPNATVAKSDGCYACIVCLIVAAMVAVNHTR